MVCSVVVPIEFCVHDFILSVVGIRDNLRKIKSHQYQKKRNEKETPYVISHDNSFINLFNEVSFLDSVTTQDFREKLILHILNKVKEGEMGSLIRIFI